ncbi:MAG TPA: potassium transporter Kup [Verrucomicrobiae bacterium]|jgi:KUP system potassium uptake protein
MTSNSHKPAYIAGLALGALGVVYGDIGTSPLYTMREVFYGTHPIDPTTQNIYGICSLVFWSLTIIVSIKYLTFVMRAANKGEGGVLTLLSLAFPDRNDRNIKKWRALMISAGVFGAALLYGDGIITPAVSILGAMEGLNVATPKLTPFVLPISVAVILLLFSVQRFGTGRVGVIFGPVMALWFLTIGALGVKGIIARPDVLLAISPHHAIRFFVENGIHGFIALAAVVLCVTGAEALYADMGHFGRRPMKLAWFWLVFPALLLNYFGQGALLLSDPTAKVNPFYYLAPRWMLYPLVALATSAAVIASQALISGAFSLTMQAIHLGYSPRMAIDHTSMHQKGQIYMPRVNWILMIGCIALVLGFKTSSNMAAAYGVAVTFTMLITNVLFFFAARRLWHWSAVKALFLCSLFFIVEGAFAGANVVKITHGGWVPLAIALMVFTFMSTWKSGRALLGKRLSASSLPIDLFLQDVVHNPPKRVPGTAIFLAGNAEGTPLAMLHNLKHNKVLHQRVVLLTVATADAPHVDEEDRVRVETLQEGFYRVRGFYGFMEEPSVPELLELCAAKDLKFEYEDTTFFLSRETIIPSDKPGMWLWRERLFAYMSRNAQRATAFFRLPANRVVELGMQIEI